LIRYDPDQCKAEALIKTVGETKGIQEFNAGVKKKKQAAFTTRGR
jgi:hypothetical protein